MSKLNIQSLFVYPVKSVRAVSMKKLTLEPRGPAGDRRWLVTDRDGKFLTQRNCARLACLTVTETSEGIKIRADTNEIAIAIPAEDERCNIVIWNDMVEAAAAGGVVDQWLTRILGCEARLFYMDERSVRQTSGNWGEKNPVSFADGYPLLIANSASLAALNLVIENNNGDAISMERFRPNIVIDGAEPWAEDFWATLKIGDTIIDLVKPCSRCVIVTKDQKTGTASGKEPLRTLTQIRRSAHPDLTGVLFGWNAIIHQEGDVHAGDAIEVIASRDEGWPLF